jgi:hypothetical protein
MPRVERCVSQRRARTFAALTGVTLLASLAGCKCDDGINQVKASFRPNENALAFGRVLENETGSRTLILAATDQGSVDVAVTVSPPFEAASAVTVPGSGQVSLEVLFRASDKPAAGTLTLNSVTQEFVVSLTGVGVHKKDCQPTQPCRDSVYDFASDECVEMMLPEGSACEPDSLCLEKGECRMGLCQGVARLCEDRDACTRDACAPGVGCVHEPRDCPAPSNPCKVATCDSDQGCGEGNAPDGTVCGNVSCVQAQLCVLGGCLTVPTPDGFLCAPKTPCQGEGRCMSQKCVKPDAGELKREFWFAVQGQPVLTEPGLLGAGGYLYAEVCDLPVPPPSGTDGGSSIDGGTVDAGPGSSAGDGGPRGCALVSWTGTGIERYVAHHPEGGERQLVHVSGAQVAMLHQQRQLELYATRNGALTLEVPLLMLSSREAISTGSQGEVFACMQPPDAGVALWRFFSDGGQQEVGAVSHVTALATDEHGTVHAYAADSGTLTSFEPLVDGGYRAGVRNTARGSAPLVVVEQQAWLGAASFFPPDGGNAAWVYPWWDGGQGRQLLSDAVLADGPLGMVFFRQCEAPLTSCPESEQTLVAHAVNLNSGTPRWEISVADAGERGQLKHAAVVSAALGAVATVAERTPLDGGTQAAFEVFGDGKRVLFCPIPGEGTISAAVIEGGILYTVSSLDGGHTLSGYDVKMLPLSSRGWPVANGVSGARRARP